MRYLSIEEIITLHELGVQTFGGSPGIRDRNLLESAAAQPLMTFDGVDLYSTLVEKAAALAYFLIKNHPFIDGNKRVGHLAMEALLMQNGYEILANTDAQEEMIMRVANSRVDLADFTNWVRQHVVSSHLI